jgi:hypothetical protein
MSGWIDAVQVTVGFAVPPVLLGSLLARISWSRDDWSPRERFPGERDERRYGRRRETVLWFAVCPAVVAVVIGAAARWGRR